MITARAALGFALGVAGCRDPSRAPPPPRASDASPAISALDAALSPKIVPDAAIEDAGPRGAGPYEIPFLGKRTVFFSVPTSRAKPQRLITNLHGVCNPPGYACGYWVHAAAERGFLVCPTGNASCGPGSYNAPTWTEPPEKMDEDLERAIGAVDASYPGEISREGSILTGFSRGGYVALRIATLHPGRWPYLIINEADVALSVPALRAAGVRAVALIAGEIGSQVAGERKTAAQLAQRGYPARLWIMPKAGHFYSANIDEIMAEAIDWVIANGEEDAGAR